MNLPANGPAAGFPAGQRVIRDAGEPAVEPAAGHLRELALFLSVHLDRAPGILWPEYDHPVFGDRTGDTEELTETEEGSGGAADGPAAVVAPAEAAELAASLEVLTGMAARVAAPGPAPAALDDAPSGHLLVHQLVGAATWHLTGAGDDGRTTSLRYRLRTGEVLYVPDGWSHTAVPTAGARWTVVVLAPGGACPG